MKTCMMGVMIATFADMAAAQPVQWRVEDGGNGHWYEGVIVSGGVDWAQARMLAQRQGGDLACCEATAERQFINEWFGISRRPDLYVPQVSWSEYPRFGPWLGGYQEAGSAETTHGWRWISGMSFDPTDVYCCNNSACDGSGESVLHLYASTQQPGVITLSWNDMPPTRMSCMAPVPSYVVEYSADCNSDGIVDKGQILSGQLPDANNNGIPDWNVSITRQPADQAVGVDQPVFFVVETEVLGNCSTPVSYRWQRRNPLVADENATNAWLDLQDGGGFLNSGTASLTILRPTPALATGYRCRISGGCGCEGTVAGAAYTNTVNFGVACPADFNADGGIDFGDIEAFFERWENGC